MSRKTAEGLNLRSFWTARVTCRDTMLTAMGAAKLIQSQNPNSSRKAEAERRT